ncbi:single-stranded DNA-binding protein [Lacticaseibacillus paracasei]|uniref:Single-strand binding protein family protein n=1 Tax=Lacticaseibacillus paracasei TaxID=1597 RepID=A0A422MDQ7_LACPA|nr:single-stranded DNA-binding protein [Lacticaseibacillus paracasei]RND88400.1 Single-strand binding protein family protein [Lacticaseibacillus paracasei]
MEDINSVQLSGTVITDVKRRQNQDFLTASTYLECIRDHQDRTKKVNVPVKLYNETAADFVKNVKLGDRVLITGRFDASVFSEAPGQSTTRYFIMAASFVKIVKEAVPAVDDQLNNPPKATHDTPTESSNYSNVLPGGFN